MPDALAMYHWQFLVIEDRETVALVQAEHGRRDDITADHVAMQLIREGIQRRREQEALAKRPIGAARPQAIK